MEHVKALAKKSFIGSNYLHEGVNLSVIVAPSKQSDLNQFLSELRYCQMDDFSSIKYTSNNDFDLIGFCPNLENMLFYRIP
jgi:hypothetical protein